MAWQEECQIGAKCNKIKMFLVVNRSSPSTYEVKAKQHQQQTTTFELKQMKVKESQESHARKICLEESSEERLHNIERDVPLVQQPGQRADGFARRQLSEKVSAERRNIHQQLDIIALAEGYSEESHRR